MNVIKNLSVEPDSMDIYHSEKTIYIQCIGSPFPCILSFSFLSSLLHSIRHLFLDLTLVCKQERNMGILRFSKREKKQPILARSYSSTASCRHAEQKDNNLNQERVALTDEFISGSAFRAILNDDNGGTLLDNILTELRPHCTDSQGIFDVVL